MKNVSILALVFVVTLGVAGLQATPSVGGEEPQITLKVRKQPLGQILKTITTQTGYSVNLEEQYKSLLVSGTFNSVPVSKFFRRALKGKSSIITISPEQRSIVVQTAIKSKYASQSARQEQYPVQVIDTTMLEQSNVLISEQYNDYLPEQMGGIFELDNNFPPKKSGNDKHIVDSQTGRPWEEIEELLN